MRVGGVSIRQKKKDRNRILYRMTNGYIHRLKKYIRRSTNNLIDSKESINDVNQNQSKAIE